MKNQELTALNTKPVARKNEGGALRTGMCNLILSKFKQNQVEHTYYRSGKKSATFEKAI